MLEFVVEADHLTEALRRYWGNRGIEPLLSDDRTIAAWAANMSLRDVPREWRDKFICTKAADGRFLMSVPANAISLFEISRLSLANPDDSA